MSGEIHELFEQLCEKLGEAEIQAVMDMKRIDDEGRALKEARWARMISETEALRRQRDEIFKVLATAEEFKPITVTLPSPTAPPTQP